ncbi:MAG: alpha-galactosidase [Planctomycetia bacterium]|nr:alpha-galactosidase [Planctomycetia bacterium]
MKHHRLIMRVLATLALVALSASQTRGFEPSVSLDYNGAAAQLKASRLDSTDGKTTWRYTTEDGKLALDVTVEEFPDFPNAVRMTSRVLNLSTTERTGVVDNLRVFSPSLPLSGAERCTINALVGSLCIPQDYEPMVTELAKGEQKEYSTPSGRSSSEVSPFIEASVDEQNGWLFALGWTGCWRANFTNNGNALDVELGMLRCHFRLEPGESLLQPSVLFMTRRDKTRRAFKTEVHRFMLAHNSPRDSEGKICSPYVALTAGGGNKSPQMMLDILNYGLSKSIPFDVYWIDAGWYGAPHEDDPYPNCGPFWYEYVGDWRVNTTRHPTGDLLPIANAIHDAGKKFLLWFEPERIHPKSPIAATEPFNKWHGMCYYGDETTFNWIEETIFGVIEKHHIDIYRQDFNMEPTGSWQNIESDQGQERVGVAEAKHIEGLYRFLDDLRARFPWIEQENCAGGGRRIDLEMVKRAYSYCRSDYYIGPKPGDTCFTLGQDMTLNLTPYLPFQGGETNCVAVGDDYGFMSVTAAGTVFTPSDFDGGIVKREFTDEETAWFQKNFTWAERLKDYYFGDFYQLTEETYARDDCWCAWSLHRPQENDGFAIAFRRAEAKDAQMTFELPAIDPNAKYMVEKYNGERQEVDGAELAQWRVNLPEARSFELIVYKKL